MIASPLVVRLLVEPLVAVWLVVVVRKLQKNKNITSRKAFLSVECVHETHTEKENIIDVELSAPVT